MNKIDSNNLNKIPKSLQESIFKYQFQDFLISQKQPKTGNLEEITNRIEVNLFNNNYRQKFEEFILEHLKYGKNKMIFYSTLGISDKAILGKPSTIDHLLISNGIVDYPFNYLLKEYPEDKDILYLNIVKTKNKINKIELCIYKEVYNEKSNLTLINYVWVEFNVDEDFFTIRVRPINNLPERYTPYNIYKEVLDQLKSIFKLSLNVKMKDAELTLYSMYKAFITEAELPYKEIVIQIEDDIINLNKKLLKKINVDEGSSVFNEIVKRHKRAIERVLIVDDIETYKNYTKNKEAIIERIAVTDDSGATANVLSGDEDGLDVAHIYFDIRDTIDDITRLNKVWVKWFFENEDNKGDYNNEIKHEQIELFDDFDENNITENEVSNSKFNFHSYQTKFEVKNTHVLITFMRDQIISKEVSDHVFSRFRSFEEI